MKAEPINRFEVKRIPEGEGGGWLITFPELPGCMSDGETIEEAIINGADAEKAWLLASEKWNEKSGKLNLRLPKTLHKQLFYRAKSENMSLNSLIVSYLHSFFKS
jgi:antitoxin HicB